MDLLCYSYGNTALECYTNICRYRKKYILYRPQRSKEKITKTKAIISTDVFGHPSDLRELKIIKGTNIKIITDSAHAPYSFYKGKITGTQADIEVLA